MVIKGAVLFMIGLTLIVGERFNAMAQEFYKGKTVTIITPFSPGGTYDSLSRLAAQFLPKYIAGEPTIIVQNRTGGGGMIGTRAAYKASPDGLTLLHIPSTFLFQSLLGQVTDIDFAKWGWLGSVGGAKPPQKFAPAIAKLPNLRDQIADETERRAFDVYMGTFNITRPFLTTPGIPPDRLQILRNALWKMMHDAEFVAAAEKQGFVLHPVGHEEVGSLVQAMFNLPKAVKEKLEEIFK